MKSFNRLVTVKAGAGKYTGAKDLHLSNFVPDGQHLVLKYVSTSSEMPPGQKPNPVIVVVSESDTVDGGSVTVQHYPVVHYQLVYGGSNIYKSSDRVYMRLRNNLVLRLTMSRDSSKGTARCFFGVSGYIDK